MECIYLGLRAIILLPKQAANRKISPLKVLTEKGFGTAAGMPINWNLLLRQRFPDSQCLPLIRTWPIRTANMSKQWLTIPALNCAKLKVSRILNTRPKEHSFYLGPTQRELLL